MMSHAKPGRVVALMVSTEDLLFLTDMAAVAEASGMTQRCKGGRVILSGYMCIHCGADPSVEGCKAPAKGAVPRSQDELSALFPMEVE